MNLKDKQVLVTGGCGYIGSHVTRQLSEAGAKVTVLDNLSTGFRDALLYGERLIEGDLADRELVEKTLSETSFKAVLHFAANIEVPESVVNPAKYYRNNTVNALNLITAVAAAGVPAFVFSSTAAVYGESGNPVSEETPPDPANPYGASKLMTERILSDMAAAHGFRHVTLRYFNVAGADLEGRIGQRTPNATHLIKAACEAAVGKRPGLTIFGEDYDTPDGSCIRDYIHIEDLAAAHLAALAYLDEGKPSVTLNCGYGHGYSVKEVINTLQQACDVSFSVEKGPRRAGDVAKVVAQADKIRRTLDWQPQHQDLAKICRSAFQWERNLKQS